MHQAAKARPIFDDIGSWIPTQLHTTSGKIPLAAVFRYALTRLKRLRLNRSILEFDNNTANAACAGLQSGVKKLLVTEAERDSKFTSPT